MRPSKFRVEVYVFFSCFSFFFDFFDVFLSLILFWMFVSFRFFHFLPTKNKLIYIYIMKRNASKKKTRKYNEKKRKQALRAPRSVATSTKVLEFVKLILRSKRSQYFVWEILNKIAYFWAENIVVLWIRVDDELGDKCLGRLTSSLRPDPNSSPCCTVARPTGFDVTASLSQSWRVISLVARTSSSALCASSLHVVVKQVCDLFRVAFTRCGATCEKCMLLFSCSSSAAIFASGMSSSRLVPPSKFTPSPTSEFPWSASSFFW